MLALVLFYACEKKPVAVVDGEAITEKMLDRYVAERLREHTDPDVSEQKMRSAAVDQLIADRLMLKGAKEAGVTVSDDDVEREIGNIKAVVGEDAFDREIKERGISLDEFKGMKKDEIMVRRFSAKLVPEGSVTEEEIKAYYQKSPVPLLMPERMYIRFVETATEEDAKGLLREMEEKKMSFDKMADLAEKENRATVSAYGWVEPDFFTPEISSALKEMKAGMHGGPYKGKSAYYVIRLEKTDKSRPKTFEEAKDEVKAILLGQRRQSTVAHWIMEKRKEADVKKY